jgi:hypothetical protein
MSDFGCNSTISEEVKVCHVRLWSVERQVVRQMKFVKVPIESKTYLTGKSMARSNTQD